MIRRDNIEVKSSSLGQAIMQCTHPKSFLSPILIGLAVQMHRMFGSRFLIDSLSHHGFSSSYADVQKFEQNSAVFHGVDLPNVPENTSTQFVADNVDHNVATLDGKKTIHGMGIIAAITPGVKKPRRIPRKDVSLTDMEAIGKISIHFLDESEREREREIDTNLREKDREKEWRDR